MAARDPRAELESNPPRQTFPPGAQRRPLDELMSPFPARE